MGASQRRVLCKKQNSSRPQPGEGGGWKGKVVEVLIDILVEYAIPYAIENWNHWFSSPTSESGDHAKAGRLEADRNEAREWEEFKVVKNNDGTYSFAAHTGFLCAVDGGGGSVVADRKEIREWEKWTLIEHNDGTVSLRTKSGYYLCAEEGNSKVVADRTDIREWEKFTLVIDKDKKMCTIKCWHGKLISAQP
jgi:hypothetical protein